MKLVLLNLFKPSREVFADCFKADPFLLFIFHVYLCHAVLSVQCRIVITITCCERTDLLALLCIVLCVFCYFPIWFVNERSGINLFWSIKNSGEILNKLKASYDCSTLYTTLPHNLIKDKLIDLIEITFHREGSSYLACNDRNAFFTSEKPKNIMHGRVKMYVMR